MKITAVMTAPDPGAEALIRQAIVGLVLFTLASYTRAGREPGE